MGNRIALRNVEYVQEILKTIGFNPERVFMEYCSSAEGDKFQKTAIIISEKINKLGKNPSTK
ncbi:MAG: hydrogenase iron-sulfur subunit [Candidatus Lokiarchaeota archaeon]|nr:hydrogenase iron-sulfur subunit [Candidatus Lokiarchaeota archaeon]